MKKVIVGMVVAAVIMVMMGVNAYGGMINRTYSIPVLADDTLAKSVTVDNVPVVSYIQELMVTIPNTTNVVTFTFTIKDSDGKTRYNISGLARNDSTLLLPARVAGNGYTFSVTPSGATGNNIIITLTVTYNE